MSDPDPLTDEERAEILGRVARLENEYGCFDKLHRALAQDVLRLLGEVDRLRAEGVERMADRLLEDTRMRALQIREGKTELAIEPARELAAVWVGVARTMLAGGENYSETPVEFDVGLAGAPERYALIVQRVGRLTPHQARKQAEATRDALAARLAHHADCGAHPVKAPDPGCPYCQDRAAYAEYLEAGGRDFRFTPSGRTVTLEELAGRGEEAGA